MRERTQRRKAERKARKTKETDKPVASFRTRGLWRYTALALLGVGLPFGLHHAAENRQSQPMRDLMARVSKELAKVSADAHQQAQALLKQDLPTKGSDNLEKTSQALDNLRSDLLKSGTLQENALLVVMESLQAIGVRIGDAVIARDEKRVGCMVYIDRRMQKQQPAFSFNSENGTVLLYLNDPCRGSIRDKVEFAQARP